METKTGGCHCKAVRYEVDIDLTKPMVECNCSHCEMKGLLLAFVPEDAVTVTSGEDALTEYRFNTGKIQHLVCSTCGVEPFGRGSSPDGRATRAINIRTIDGIDLASVMRMPYDGKSK